MSGLPPFADVPVWRGPDCPPRAHADRPFYADDYPAILAFCREGLDLRQRAYPERIAKGTMTREEAQRDIAGWSALTAEWAWICAEGPEADAALPAPVPDTFPARREAVRIARERADHEMDRGNRSYDVLRKSHLLDALEWHLVLDKWGEQPVHRCLRLTRDARADAAAARAAAGGKAAA